MDMASDEETTGNEPVSLGDAAQTALSSIGDEQGAQETLDGTDYTKVKFVGMAFDSLESSIKIGDEMVFMVRARCVGTGDEASKRDGNVRHYAKMDVQSVVLREDVPA